MKFRKKPVVIEAVQLIRQNAEELKIFLKDAKSVAGWVSPDGSLMADHKFAEGFKEAIQIHTLEV